MRILVTGGAGFIGSHFVRSVLGNSYPNFRDAYVTVLDLLTYAGNPANLPIDHQRLTFVKGDICDADLLRLLLPAHDAVVNFAAESHVDRSLNGPGDFVRSNVLGAQNLFDACLAAGIGTVVHVSTDEVYGSVDEGLSTEEHSLQPNSPYAASKAGADLIARSYGRSHGLDVRITRGSNNYGPYQHTEKLIPAFTTNLLSGYPVSLYGDGHNVREWLHVDDYCHAVQLVLGGGKPGTVYNVAGGLGLNNRELTSRLLELCGGDWSMVRHVPDRKAHDRRYAMDDTKIRAELGYAPRWSFDHGLAETVRWYQDNPQWWKSLASVA